MRSLRKLVIKVFGEIREYDLATTTIDQIMNLMSHAKDFEIIEYKEVLCEE